MNLKPTKGMFKIIGEAGGDFMADEAMTQSAAVAFYSALSFAPLLMVTVIVLGVIGPDTQQAAVNEVSQLIGSEAGGVVKEITETADAQERTGQLFSLTGAIGLVALIWSASGVFAQLQAAMNQIWDVEPKPAASLKGGVWSFLRTRILSVGLIFSVLFLLLASLAVTAILDAILPSSDSLWLVLNALISGAVYIVLFGLIFKFLPDVKIPWRAVLFGAVVTGLLFLLGKTLIGVYLGRSNPGTSYGAAGSVVVLLVWVYYSAIILFFGAELTQVWARHSGYVIKPDKHAKRLGQSKKTSAVRQDAGKRESDVKKHDPIPGRGERKGYELEIVEGRHML